MPFSCAVRTCNNSRKTAKNVRYHRFPKDEALCNIWIKKCNRLGQIVSRNSVICSAHFTEDDYERDLKGELLNLPLKRVLKNGAVPSILLPMADDDRHPKTGTDRVKQQQTQDASLIGESLPNNEVNLETDCKVFVMIESPMVLNNCISGTVLTVAQFPELCRSCLSRSVNASIFNLNYEGLDFRSMFETCCAIQIHEGDSFPQNVCNNCIGEIIRLHQFRLRCQQSNEILKDVLCYETSFLAKNNGNNETEVSTVEVKEEDANSSSSVVSEESIELKSNEERCRESDGVLKDVLINETNFVCKNNLNIDRESREEKDYENCSEQTNLSSVEIKDIPKDVANIRVSKINKKRSPNVRKKHKRFLPVCSKCDIKFGDFKELLKHCGKTGHAKPENFKCELCEKSFCTHWGLNTHRRMAHSEKRHLCNVCGKPFVANSTLKRHMKKHTGERSHICEYCGKSFWEKDHLAVHTRIHVDKERFASDGIGYRCRYCDKLSVTAMSLKSHERNHLVRSILENKRKDIEGNVDKDPKIFKHMCTICNKLFFTKAGLVQHLTSSVHSEHKRYLCSTCGKSFFSNSGLQLHLKIHADAKAYSCDICKKSFNTRASLKSHQIVHKSDKPYPCKLCEISFKSRMHLKRHMNVHSGEKPHSCNFCEKKFALKENLQAHVRTHTGEAPYACEICGKRFYHNNNRKKHMHKHDSVKDSVK